MTFLFTNNAKTILAEALTATATSISLASGAGSDFPSPSSGEMFALFLTGASDSSLVEVCYCTARSSDTLTVTRGMDGTTASAFSVGDYVTLGPVAGVTSLFAQAGNLGNYSTTVTSNMGGYSLNAILADSSSVGEFWVSTAANNTTKPGATDANWQSLFTGYISGVYGLVSSNGDKEGIGLHLDGSTSKASFVYSGGSGDLAWYSDVTTEASTRASADTALSSAITTEVTRAKAAEADLVSGTLGVISANGDKQGTGLHYDGSTGNASFVYESGSFDLASQTSLASEISARESADSSLSSAISAEAERAEGVEATLISGTSGVISTNGDKDGTGLHYDGSTSKPSFIYSGGSGDLAWASDVTSEASARESADSSLSSAISNEETRAKAAEATLVSGTSGVISANGDKDGTGLHYDGSTSKPSFVYDGGSGDLAWASDVTAEASARESADSTLSTAISTETSRAEAAEADLVSGTSGVISANGDKQGTGLHLDGSTGNASFVYDGGSFDLASYSALTAMPTLYTGSTSLTVASGKSVAVIKLIGGGGSGCSVKGTSIADSTYGAGGAAGGYVHFWISVASGDTLGITVGAGAASPTNTVNGQTNGGDTIVTLNGTEVARASGGTGGVWNSVSSCAGGTGGGATTQNGATPLDYSNGTDGGDGQTGAESISSVTGYGGPGVWGGGGRAGNGGGQSGTGFGAGGGGAYDTSYSDTFYGGGAGHDGCAVVEFK